MKFIKLHERNRTPEGPVFLVPICVNIDKIALIERVTLHGLNNRTFEFCDITLGGTTIHIEESFEQVIEMLEKATEEAEKGDEQ